MAENNQTSFQYLSWIYSDDKQNTTFTKSLEPFDTNNYIPSTEWNLVHAGAERRSRYSPFRMTSYSVVFRANWIHSSLAVGKHRPQFERFLKDFFDEYERHLAENFHAFCVIL